MSTTHDADGNRLNFPSYECPNPNCGALSIVMHLDSCPNNPYRDGAKAVAAALLGGRELNTENQPCDCGAASVGSDAHYADCSIALIRATREA